MGKRMIQKRKTDRRKTVLTEKEETVGEIQDKQEGQEEEN